jgi:26 proteasome complex subunit DSS1
MSSAAASSSKPAENQANINEQTKEEDTQPTLGVLEEDDEFEEFAVAGSW